MRYVKDRPPIPAIALTTAVALWRWTPLIVPGSLAALMWLATRIARTRTSQRARILIAWALLGVAAAPLVGHQGPEPVSTDRDALVAHDATACPGPAVLARLGLTESAVAAYSALLSPPADAPPVTDAARACAERGLAALQPTCARGLALAAAGDEDAARQVLRSVVVNPIATDPTSAPGDATDGSGDPTEGEETFAQRQTTCAIDALAALDAPEDVAELVVDQIADPIRAWIDGPADGGGEGEDEDGAQLEVGGGDTDLGVLGDLLRLLVWVIPFALVLATVRELVLGYQLRQPGPVEVKTAIASKPLLESEATLDLPAMSALMQERLSRAGIGSPALTPGGAGQLVVPATAWAEATFGKLGELLRSVVAYVVPEAGYVASTTMWRRNERCAATIALQPKGPGRPAAMATITGDSWRQAADLAACTIYAWVTDPEPVARRQAVWNRWSGSAEGLVHHQRGIRLRNEDDLLGAANEFRAAAHHEPASAVTRIEWSTTYSRLAHRATQEHCGAEQIPGDMGIDDATTTAWYLSAVETAMSATLLAPTLVEARLRLAVACHYASWWVSQLGDAARYKLVADESLVAPADRLLDMIELMVTSRAHLPFTDRAEEQRRTLEARFSIGADLQAPRHEPHPLLGEGAEDGFALLAETQFELCTQLLGWPCAVLRWLDPTTRASIGRGALPWQSKRLEAKDLARAGRLATARRRALATGNSEGRGRTAALRWLGVKRFVRPKGGQSAAGYNLAIAWVRQGELDATMVDGSAHARQAALRRAIASLPKLRETNEELTAACARGRASGYTAIPPEIAWPTEAVKGAIDALATVPSQINQADGQLATASQELVRAIGRCQMAIGVLERYHPWVPVRGAIDALVEQRTLAHQLREVCERARREISHALEASESSRRGAVGALTNAHLANRRRFTAGRFDGLVTDPDFWPQRDVRYGPGAYRPGNRDPLGLEPTAPEGCEPLPGSWWRDFNLHTAMFAIDAPSDVANRRRPFNPFVSTYVLIIEAALRREQQWRDLAARARVVEGGPPGNGSPPLPGLGTANAATPEILRAARRLVETELQIADAARHWLIATDHEVRDAFAAVIRSSSSEPEGDEEAAEDEDEGNGAAPTTPSPTASFQKRAERYASITRRQQPMRAPDQVAAAAAVATEAHALFGELLSDRGEREPPASVSEGADGIADAWRAVLDGCLVASAWPLPTSAATARAPSGRSGP